jgi:hypothetical protein
MIEKPHRGVNPLVRRGAPGRDRTCDHRIRSPLLYPLSYGRPDTGGGASASLLRLTVGRRRGLRARAMAVVQRAQWRHVLWLAVDAM